MNAVSLIGRLTVDPDVYHDGDGRPAALFHLAVDDHRDRDRGPFLVTVVTEGARARTVARFLRRDRIVAVEGRLQAVDGGNQHGRWHRLQLFATSVDFLDHHPTVAVGNGAATVPATGGDDG